MFAADKKPNYICKTKFHCPPCSEDTSHSARRVHSTPLGGCIPLRSEGASHSARRVHFTPLGGCTSLRSEGTFHSAGRMSLVLLGATPQCFFIKFSGKENLKRTENKTISIKPSFTVRPARRMPLVLPEACYSSCSERIARPARRVHLTPFGWCISLRSEGASHSARRVLLAMLEVCRSSCSEGAVPKVIMYASTIKSEKYFRNIGDKSRAGIGVYFVEYGVNFRLRKCHYCKSRF